MSQKKRLVNLKTQQQKLYKMKHKEKKDQKKKKKEQHITELLDNVKAIICVIEVPKGGKIERQVKTFLKK